MWRIISSVTLGFSVAFAQQYLDLYERGDSYIQIRKHYESQLQEDVLPPLFGEYAEESWMLFRRWEYFWEPRVDAQGNFPEPSIIWKAWENDYRNRLHNPKTPATLTQKRWREIGPRPRIPVGGGAGRLNAVAWNPHDYSQLWVAAPSGGVWYSTNFGESWNSRTDHLPALGVSDIAINPQNTQQVFVATGDGDGGAAYSYGVLRSDDGGLTWNQTGLEFQLNQTRQMRRLFIHPQKPHIILCGTSNGLYRTTNGGHAWSMVRSGNFKDIEPRPSNPDVIYAASTSGIYRSTDAGATWILLSEGLPSTGYIRIEIATTLANPDYIYALYAASNGGFGGLYRSTDGGNTWTLRSNSPNIMGWYSGTGNDTRGQGSYDLALAVHPFDAERVVAGGINIWLSTDGGIAWRKMTSWTGSPEPYVHADIHMLAFTPDGTQLLACTDGGLFIGNEWAQEWVDRSDGLGIMQFYKIAIDPDDGVTFLGGTQDNGTNYYDGVLWRQVNGADGMDTFFEPNSSYAYSTIYYGQIYRSSNNGRTFSRLAPPENGPWVTVFTYNPLRPSTIYGGYNSGIWVSYNRGSTWQKFSQTSLGGVAVAIAIPRHDTSLMYVATSSGIFMSTDGGRTLNNITMPNRGANFRNLAVHPENPSILVVVQTGFSATNKVWYTSDGGQSWQNITEQGLPNVPTNCVTIYSHRCGGVIIVGTDLGVYYRRLDKIGWERLGEGLPNTIVTDLEINGRILRAGTYGRGAWEVELDDPSPRALFTQTSEQICAGEFVQFFPVSQGVTTQWEFPGGDPSTSRDITPTVHYVKAGVYRVRLHVSSSCGSDEQWHDSVVTVFPLPTKPSIISEGNTLRAIGQGRFQWYRDGIAVSGATTSVIRVLDNALYSVRVTDDNGCSNVSDTLRPLLGIETATTSDITVIWDRNDQALVITSPIPMESVLRVVDLQGRVVIERPLILQQGFPERVYTVQRPLASGIYFVNFITRGVSLLPIPLVVD